MKAPPITSRQPGTILGVFQFFQALIRELGDGSTYESGIWLKSIQGNCWLKF
jgi:hypothetical protein